MNQPQLIVRVRVFRILFHRPDQQFPRIIEIARPSLDQGKEIEGLGQAGRPFQFRPSLVMTAKVV